MQTLNVWCIFLHLSPLNYPNHPLNIWDIKTIESHFWNLIFDLVSIHTTKTLGVHLPDLGNEKTLDFQRSKITFRHLDAGFKYFWSSSLPGEMIQFVKYFSKGLKSPTSHQWGCYPRTTEGTVTFQWKCPWPHPSSKHRMIDEQKPHGMFFLSYQSQRIHGTGTMNGWFLW